MPRKQRGGSEKPPHYASDLGMDRSADENRSGENSGALVGREKRTGTCPVCGRYGKLDVTPRPDGGSWVSCWTCESRGLNGGDYLRALAAAVDAPGGGAVLADPLNYLGPWLNGPQPERAPAPLLTVGAVCGWASRLLASPEPLAYLFRRGIALETITRHRLGWDGIDLIFPVYEGGELVNVRRRRPGDGAQMRGLREHGAQLYPNVPPRGTVVLVAGEFDALIGRQHRVRTVTTTCGCKLPDYLVPQLAERAAAVAYDVGEEAAAEATAAKLRAAGSEAWLVRIALLGLAPGGDLNDHFRDGGTTRELLALIRRERGAS